MEGLRVSGLFLAGLQLSFGWLFFVMGTAADLERKKTDPWGDSGRQRVCMAASGVFFFSVYLECPCCCTLTLIQWLYINHSIMFIDAYGFFLYVHVWVDIYLYTYKRALHHLLKYDREHSFHLLCSFML